MLVFGEFAMLQVCYLFYIFNMAEDVEKNFLIGYAPIAVLGLYILICLIIIIVEFGKGLWIKARFCCAKRQYKKSRSLLQSKLKLNH